MIEEQSEFQTLKELGVEDDDGVVEVDELNEHATDATAYMPGDDEQFRSGKSMGRLMEEYQESRRLLERGLKQMRLRGGPGQRGIALVDGNVKTVEENVATAIAWDMADDACRRTGKKLRELTLLELNRGLAQRVRGRSCTEAQVGAELARLQNREIYGSRPSGH